MEAGAVSEADFPYQAAEAACNPPHPHDEKINSWSYMTDNWDIPQVAELQQAIYEHGPVAALVCDGPAFKAYSGGVFRTDEGNCTDHAIVLVGWDDSEGYWILRNSWGTSWGEGGYMRIAYGISGVGRRASYVNYGEQPPQAADLSVAKSDSPDPVIAGNTLSYSVTATNNGPGEATDVQITDQWPPELRLDSYSAPGASCSVSSTSITCTWSVRRVLARRERSI